jgi:AcrR family transcriptional regulator
VTGRSAQSEITRQRLETEALRLFHQQGFRATTMRQITGACDLTSAAFYNHFRSKDHLLESLINDAHDDLDRAITTAVAGADPDPGAQLAAIVRAMTVWHCGHPELARVANRDFRDLQGTESRAVIARRRALRAVIEDVLDRGVALGVLQPPGRPEVPSRMVAILILNLMTTIPEWYNPAGPVQPPELAALYEDTVRRITVRPAWLPC